MPSYVDANLMTGEQVVHRARLHWGIFVGPAILIFIGLIIFISLAASAGEVGAAIGFIILIVFAIPMIRAVTRFLTTEFAVTSRRVIVKVGLIRRFTIELNHRQIEGLTLSQGIVARIFGAGTIVVNGTGSTAQPVHFVANVMEFRRSALETIDASS